MKAAARLLYTSLINRPIESERCPPTPRHYPSKKLFEVGRSPHRPPHFSFVGREGGLRFYNPSRLERFVVFDHLNERV